MCDAYSYLSKPPSLYFEGSVVKECFVASKKSGHDGDENCTSKIRKTVQVEISELKSTTSSRNQTRFTCIADENFYSDRYSNKSISPSYSSSTAAAGYFEDAKIEKSFSSSDKMKQEVVREKSMDLFQVVSKGTKLMKSINMPTVIVKVHRRNLDKSMLYYVILESKTGGIPAVMFSNPYAHKKTRFAELLPLYFAKSSKSVCLKPILRRKRWRRVFHRGFFFKVKTLLQERAFYISREHS